jgi:fructokinase
VDSLANLGAGDDVIRIGVDFGGTKIEAAALDRDGAVRARRRAPNPGDYLKSLQVVRELVEAVAAETEAGPVPVGMAVPGSISPRSGLIRNANSTWLNGRPFLGDLQSAMARKVRLANDANCFALSEATDGAAIGASVVFGVILGTGCGGGLVTHGRIVEGKNGIGGEWGHTPLPWAEKDEHPGPSCWCGRRGCMETFVSGKAFAADFARASGRELAAEAIVAEAHEGKAEAAAALKRYIGRLGRGLAMICDVVDPDIIVLGGGMSNVDTLYTRLPGAVAPHIFSDSFATRIVRASHGDSSGVRGAAWLWP